MALISSETGRILPKEIPLPKTDGKRRHEDWIKAWLDHMAEVPAPHVYKLWSGLSTIAAVAQRKIFRITQAWEVYPNMYVWLVGPPGTGKSISIYCATRLLKGIPSVYFTSDSPSIVGLMKDFKDVGEIQKDHQSLNAFISELNSFFENAKDEMAGFLTHIYDCKPDYFKRTRAGGDERIPFPWLNMLAGTTPRWLGDNLPANASETGLMARVLTPYAEEINYDSPEPELTPEFAEREKHLIHDLTHILQIYGNFTWGEGGGPSGRMAHEGPCRTDPGSGSSLCGCGDAWRWFDRWHRDRGRMPRIPDPRTQGYFVRKPLHLQKVAMLTALSRRDDRKYYTEDLVTALALLDSTEGDMRRAFSSVGTNPHATDFERIDYQIRSAEGMFYQDIMNTNIHNLDEPRLEATMRALVAAGKVTKVLAKRDDGTQGIYYAPKGEKVL